MLLRSPQLNEVVTVLESRAVPEGGFCPRSGEPFRSDSTAWGVLALSLLGPVHSLLGGARDKLITAQDSEGMLSVSQEHEEAFWPTSLAVLAWNGSQLHETYWKRSVLYLLKTTGQHRSRIPGEPAGHDPSIHGWPWIRGTHSWIEPTVLAVIALKVTGYGQHDRTREAIRMILNRQLPHGGWNYGNTLVFGRELHPMPESAGAALTALAGEVAPAQVARSLDYLHGEVDRLRTPISLGWALLGLGAWGQWPSNGLALVERCLANQSRYGAYDTSALGVLVLGACAGGASGRHPFLDKPNSVAASMLQ